MEQDIGEGRRNDCCYAERAVGAVVDFKITMNRNWLGFDARFGFRAFPSNI